MIYHSEEKRRRAYERWLSGEKKSAISRDLQIDYDTLLIWTKRFSEEGELGIQTRYERCGRRISDNAPIRDRAIELRQANEDWGADYIRLQLEREFPGKPMVKANQIRKWLKSANLILRKTKLPPSKDEWVDKPLARVQVDAKERLTTQDGKPCCYLNYLDEYTGAELDAFVFPLRPD